ncbi:hypothetical protein SeLEV6574_g07798 [Synchytrium endobioticum]|uniref:Uncharacterized protein n=1 Tax=Synchytrium endobioticum TaxID=286115 RepID=A0A507CKH1_9FUNG|nr:hypothetical protein SeLEV6574_g07798 [Synchytrium endobioticum]
MLSFVTGLFNRKSNNRPSYEPYPNMTNSRRDNSISSTSSYANVANGRRNGAADDMEAGHIHSSTTCNNESFNNDTVPNSDPHQSNDSRGEAHGSNWMSTPPEIDNPNPNKSDHAYPANGFHGQSISRHSQSEAPINTFDRSGFHSNDPNDSESKLEQLISKVDCMSQRLEKVENSLGKGETLTEERLLKLFQSFAKITGIVESKCHQLLSQSRANCETVVRKLEDHKNMANKDKDGRRNERDMAEKREKDLHRQIADLEKSCADLRKALEQAKQENPTVSCILSWLGNPFAGSKPQEYPPLSRDTSVGHHRSFPAAQHAGKSLTVCTVFLVTQGKFDKVVEGIGAAMKEQLGTGNLVRYKFVTHSIAELLDASKNIAASIDVVFLIGQHCNNRIRMSDRKSYGELNALFGGDAESDRRYLLLLSLADPANATLPPLDDANAVTGMEASEMIRKNMSPVFMSKDPHKMKLCDANAKVICQLNEWTLATTMKVPKSF